MSGGSKGAKRPLKRPLDGGVRPHSGPDAQHWLDPTIAHSNLRSNCETSALVLYLTWSTLNSPDRWSHLFFRSCALTSRSLSDRFPLNSPAKCSHSSARRRSLFTARGTAALAPLALRSAGLGFLAPWCDASPGAAEACDALWSSARSRNGIRERGDMVRWGLTFDMSGGRRQAKLAGARPLDGGVRCHFSRSGVRRRRGN